MTNVYKLLTDIYPIDIYVSFGVSKKEACESIGVEYDGGGSLWKDKETTGMVSKLSSSKVLIAFKYKNPDKGLIAHEAVHAKNYVSELLGKEIFCEEQSEPEAYFVQWIFNCVIGAIKENKECKKKRK